MSGKSLARMMVCLGAFSYAPAQQPSSIALEQAQCKFQDYKDVTVRYSAMRTNGRKIFGDLVPYGKAWVTGEGQSPTFVTDADVVVGGKEFSAGSYTLSTVPDVDKWTMVLTKMDSRTRPGQADETAKIDLLVRQLQSPVETFTISFDQPRGGCVLYLRWEQTEASVLLAEKK